MTSILIAVDANCTEPEKQAARILAARIQKRSNIDVETVQQTDAVKLPAGNPANLVVVLGTPANNRLVSSLLADLNTRLPTLPNSEKIHPESFVAKTGQLDGRNILLIAGSEPRSTIYSVGAVLRSLTYLSDSVLLPELDLQEKPALWIRGGQPSGPGSRARQFGDLRPQTADEHREVKEDLMLLGTNVFGGSPTQNKPYGMMSKFGRTANEMPAGFPRDWGADDGRSPKYVCPSVPEARAALLESFDKMFRDAPSYDFFTTNSGDVGGCRCDRCMPWGRTYIELMHEISKLLHKYHPDTKILATNQDLTNEGNQQLFEYLNSHNSDWLFAIRYGPGADEMQTYIRGAVNPKWFQYEGFGPFGNYLKQMHHRLPTTTNIALYTDITHWMQSQFAVQKPDIALAAVYNRRSWNARPKHFHRVAQEIFHYALGDMHYSEGMHDDFNKWLWYRLMWNPHQSHKSLTQEYCRHWFGPAAQDEMTAAIYLMEQTLEKSVQGNPGIAKAVALLRSAGEKIPENLKRVDYRWRIISQKALMDRYIQLLLNQGLKLKENATKVLKQVDRSQSPKVDLQQAIKILNQSLETAEMKTLIAEARKLGEESNQTIGYRVPATFIIENLDLTEVGWWKQTLQKALDNDDVSQVKNSVKMILQYYDPGEGGYYDNFGWPNQPKHLTQGDWLWGFFPFPGPARRSHYTLAYTFSHSPGVTAKYDQLDTDAQYVLRLSIGDHRSDEGEAAELLRNIKMKQGIQADGQALGEEFDIPRGGVTYQEVDIPQNLTEDGKLTIGLTNSSKFLPITAAYEMWLMRKDKMPWTTRP